MRLDKYLSAAGAATRSETMRAVREGAVSVNGTAVKSPSAVVSPGVDTVVYRGSEVIYRQWIYIMLNKPEGYISATDDSRAPVVTSLLPPADASRVFPCGRLDKYTTGLILLTDDGVLSHRLLAPARHVEKVYAYTCKKALTPEDIDRLESGVYIEGGYLTSPCRVLPDGELSGIIAITEGKYHQIKQMFRAVGNEIISLERLTFGPLELDTALPRGGWRYLYDIEINALREAAQIKT